MKKSIVTGFFIGIVLYSFIFGIRVFKVLIRSGWKFDMIRKGLYKPFNDPVFLITQLLIITLCVAGSITLYCLYKEGYFFQK